MDIVDKVLKASGFKTLNPPQELALKAGLLEDKSMVVASPTASGKTLIAEMAALNTIQKGGKVVYIVPLRALASEKYEEFRDKYKDIKVGLSTGDLDSGDPWLVKYDIIVTTSEKFDSLLRHGITWLNDIRLIVADEIHLLNDPTRGPTLEMVLTRIRQFVNPTIIALSATISNYEELADWLGAEKVKSDFRPVDLYRGVCFEDKVNFVPQREIKLNSKNSLLEILKNTLQKNKQALVFVSTRRSTEASAENLGKGLNIGYKLELENLSYKILKVLESPTRQCERLARCIKTGTAFHHAGLTSKQRKLIEEGFKSGLIKVIAATPTLAMGVNLPAYRVILRDLKRFSSIRGTDYLPNLEVQQICGRAGRPAFDSEGEAILMAKSKQEAQYAWDNYIQGEPEKIFSKLGVEPVLRTHVLALISSGITPTKKDLFEFFSKTFYAHQYKDLSQLNFNLEKVLNMLEKYNFITVGKKESSEFVQASKMVDENLKPSRIGKRVAELYIDPITANTIIDGLTKMTPNHTNIIQLLCNCLEMKPLLNLRKGDYDEINMFLASIQDDLLFKPPNDWDFEYEDYLRSMKTINMFSAWMEEDGENQLLETFHITPGELRVRLDNADWLLYATQELGLLMNLMDTLKHVRKVRLRIKYGIKEELLPLIKLKSVGRARARRLFESKLKSPSDLRKVPVESLARIVGPKTAEEIKKQV